MSCRQTCQVDSVHHSKEAMVITATPVGCTVWIWQVSASLLPRSNGRQGPRRRPSSRTPTWHISISAFTDFGIVISSAIGRDDLFRPCNNIRQLTGGHGGTCVPSTKSMFRCSSGLTSDFFSSSLLFSSVSILVPTVGCPCGLLNLPLLVPLGCCLSDPDSEPTLDKTK
jgi:hypothetical protein